MPYKEPTRGEQFRKRLAVYLIGVTLGCVLMGLYFAARPQRPQPQQPAPASAPAPASSQTGQAGG